MELPDFKLTATLTSVLTSARRARHCVRNDSDAAKPKGDKNEQEGQHLSYFVRLLRRKMSLLSLVVIVTACSDASVKFPTKENAQAEVDGVTVIRLDTSNVVSIGERLAMAAPTTLPTASSGEYRIGPGDVISIFVLDHPELTIPPGTDPISKGYLVQTDGSLTFPFIGNIKASGKTVEELRKDMSAQLAVFFPNPQVDVRITGFYSQRVVIGGEVASPTTEFIRATPLTLLEAINAAGGMTPAADPRSITVRRGGVNHRVDLEAFLTSGIAGNNPLLQAGDVVSVPRKALHEAYVLGEIQTPATIDLTNDPVSLTQALTRQGGINEARADARGIFVFREVAGEMTVYQLDTSKPTALLLGTRFALQPMDVVYVTKSPLQRWNDTISRILPSVTAASTVGLQ